VVYDVRGIENVIQLEWTYKNIGSFKKKSANRLTYELRLKFNCKNA